MLQRVNQTESRDLDWSCQAVSPIDEPCELSLPSTAVSAGNGLRRSH